MRAPLLTGRSGGGALDSVATDQEELKKWYLARDTFLGRGHAAECADCHGQTGSILALFLPASSFTFHSNSAGLKYRAQDMALGLALAAECSHPDAKWLVELFSDSGPPRNEEEAKEVFLAQGCDARALAFAGLVGCIIDKQCLLVSARMGCAQAQAWMSLFAYERSRVAFAEQAASQSKLHSLERQS